MKRRYLDRIEVWQRNQLDDTVGGNAVTPVKLSDSWANVKTLSREKVIAYGLDLPAQAIRVKVRKRNDLDYFEEGIFIKYKSKDWHISSIMEVDLDGEELDMVAVTMQ